MQKEKFLRRHVPIFNCNFILPQNTGQMSPAYTFCLFYSSPAVGWSDINIYQTTAQKYPHSEKSHRIVIIKLSMLHANNKQCFNQSCQFSKLTRLKWTLTGEQIMVWYINASWSNTSSCRKSPSYLRNQLNSLYLNTSHVLRLRWCTWPKLTQGGRIYPFSYCVGSVHSSNFPCVLP